MRRSMSRTLSTLLLVGGIVSCSESPTDLHRVPLRLALAPRFSPQAEAIYRSLSAFAVTLDNVHVVVRGVTASDAPGPLLKDTTIAFPATASEITIDIDLAIQGSEQGVVAAVELREGTTTYFAGSQTIVAKLGETTGSPEPVEMSYVGPGATASFLTIAPQPATLAPSVSFPFTVQVFDQLERAVTDLPLTWSTSDATIATVSQSGVVTSTGKTGSTTLTVKGLNGISGQTTINVQPVAKLFVLQGDNQTAIAGVALAVSLAVQAVDANNNPVIGATITFAGLEGRGSVSPSSATTNGGGLATTVLTLGPGIGTYTFTATAAGSPAATTRVTATATAGAVASLGISGGNNQVDTVLATLGQPLSVKVTDSFGNPVASQAVDFQVTSGHAALLPIEGANAVQQVRLTTGGDGVALVMLVGDALAGPVRVTASIPQSTIAAVTFGATFGPGAAALLSVIQQPLATAQATLPLGIQPKVQVTDRHGNAVAVPGRSIIARATALDCSRCGRVNPPPTNDPLLNRVPSSTANQTPRRLTPKAPTTTRISVPVAIARTQSVSDTFPEGVGGTTQVKTDANGVATFTNLSLDLPVGTWQLVFADTITTEALAPAATNNIVLSPGPIQSIIAWSLPDTTFLAFPGDTLFPSVRVIDKVGNGVPNVPVDWKTVDIASVLLGNTSTTTDADGFAAAGQWVIPVGTNVLQFVIQATPSAPPELKVENSPLSFYAILQPPIGRVVPPTVSSPPR
jgi:hypothetical protein